MKHINAKTKKEYTGRHNLNRLNNFVKENNIKPINGIYYWYKTTQGYNKYCNVRSMEEKGFHPVYPPIPEHLVILI